MNWINVYGLICVAIIMIPNIIFAMKCKDGFDNMWENKWVEILEQIGRFGCFGFMVFIIPGISFGFSSNEAFVLYLIVNGILVFFYCLIWAICFKKNSIFRALALSIIPSVLFLSSGILSNYVPLIIMATIFAPCHILISYKNAAMELGSHKGMDQYLHRIFTEETKYVDFSHPLMQKKADELFSKDMTNVEKAKKAYYFVRDDIPHSFDIGATVVSISASDVLKNGTGICHVKSNLLAALLRSQGIPAGFCFQYLTLDDNDDSRGYVTHGYNAVYLDGHWVKLDARGNKENVHAEFSLEEPILAFPVREEFHECYVPGIFARPNMSSMKYLEKLEKLDIDKYADFNMVQQQPDVLDE